MVKKCFVSLNGVCKTNMIGSPVKLSPIKLGFKHFHYIKLIGFSVNFLVTEKNICSKFDFDFT